MFMGPLDQEKPWDTQGMIGMFRFLKKVHTLAQGDFSEVAGTYERHRLIKKVTDDIASLDMNTAIAAMMEFVNLRQKGEGMSREDMLALTRLLAPFAPHLGEEVWQEILGQKGSVQNAAWPEYDEQSVMEEEVTIAVQVNGKLRGTMDLQKGVSEGEVVNTARKIPAVVQALDGVDIVRTVFVPDRIINFITKKIDV
jgi:leucyl-tRNA synthetase